MKALFSHAGAALLALTLLAACGGGGSDTPAPPDTPTTPPPTTPVTLSATTSAGQLLAGGTATLTATVSDNSAVTWQLAAGAPGTLSATTGASITYTAPATVAVPTPVTVTATAGSASMALQVVVNPDPGAAGLSLIAGALGSHTVVDGTGTAARFAYIQQVALAPDGSFLVADGGMRRVSAAGTVATIARFSGLVQGLAAAADGSARLVRTAPETGVTMLYRTAADGTLSAIGSPSALLDGVSRLVAGAGDDLYGISSCRIIRLTGGGVATVLAGGTCTSSEGNDGQGSAAGFSNPADLARAANGDLYVADGQRVRRVTPAGAVTTLALMDAATGTGLPIGTWLQSVAARPDGTLAVLARDTREQVVYRLQPDGTLTALARRALVKHVNQSDFTTHLTDFTTLRADSTGKLLLASLGDLQLVQGSTLAPFAGLEDDSLADVDGAGTAARFVTPTYVAADLRGNTYVTDNAMLGVGIGTGLEGSGLTLRRIDAAGNVTTILSNDAFGRPRGLLADQSGNLYVTEQSPMAGRINQLGGAVYKITPNGILTRIAGGYDSTIAIVDGKGDAARFVVPTFAGIAPDGTLYVNDHRINDTTVVLRKVAPDGTVATVTALPDDVGRAPDGQRYGYGNDTVYRINADGSHTVVAGQEGRQGTVLGALPGAVTPPAPYWPLLPVGQLTPTGLHTFTLISNGAIVKLVLPH